MKISDIKAWEIIDSRGNPTIATKVILDDDTSATAMVPSGASTGTYEAVELRDQDSNRYMGKGVLKAIKNIEEKIKPLLIGLDPSLQEEIDTLMIKADNTENKGNFGANAILAVSLAVAKAAAKGLNMPLYRYLAKFNPNFNGTFLLPLPMMNIANGGRHANWSTDIQEYMIIPIGAQSMKEAVRFCAEIYQSLKTTLKDKKYSTTVGDEGGFAPNVESNEEIFTLISEAVEKAGYVLGKDIAFAIDAAASEFYKNNIYELKKEGKELSGEELADFYKKLMEKYPIISLEDVFAEDDWDNFKNFTIFSKDKYQVVGDDLFVTNIERLKKGIEEGSANSILIKFNQIGTLTETIKTILLAKENGLTSVISHRSGETEDTFIADLAVAFSTGQIKTGAPARSERTAKYNRLLEIENEAGSEVELAEFPFKINN
ncbi:MAG: phosphopyruvate hydratase [Patescibacteria group bacterium]|jgi:enolase|nr:phosphopyruvate hydratase [Patescibacteria group bacterium]